jgi:tRNA-Thr(GGU) m(6)t(6)A37 methyltransferase TsaA
VGIVKTIHNLWPFANPLIRRDPVSYTAIGVVRNRIREHRAEGWEAVRSDLFLRPQFAEALNGVEGFSHVIVVFHMHRIDGGTDVRLTLPLADENDGEIGLFATRIPARPNAIGVAVVRLLRRRKNVLRVRGLDALDGSPVLDLKPYLPAYDSVPSATLADWARRAIESAGDR